MGLQRNGSPAVTGNGVFDRGGFWVDGNPCGTEPRGQFPAA